MRKRNHDPEEHMDVKQKRYITYRTVAGLLLLLAVILIGITVIGKLRLRLTREQIFKTNRVRIETVINGLSAGVVEKDGLYEEYDQLYIAKLENTRYYYNNFDGRCSTISSQKRSLTMRTWILSP